MFDQLASVEFSFGNEVQTVKVENVPFVWNGRDDRDIAALSVCAAYVLDKTIIAAPLRPIWVEVSAPKNQD